MSVTAATRREVCQWLVAHTECHNLAGSTSAMALVRSRKRWPPHERGVWRKLLRLCRAHGYDGKPLPESVWDWLRNVDWEKVWAIAKVLLSILLAILAI